MTLDQAKQELANATTDQARKDWERIVHLKEARIAAGGPEEILVARKPSDIPIGENPYDNAFRGMSDANI
jgi:hypothetical protein